MTKTRKTMAGLLAVGALAMSASPAAFAAPSPATEGGNGAGASGQCTGNPDGRPSSCHDQGGPGNQP